MSCKRRKNCRLCDSSDLAMVFGLAPTPPANNFLRQDQLKDPEEKFPLDVFFCNSCKHVQILDVVDPEILFRNYVYVSGTSTQFVQHFQRYADAICSKYGFKSGQFAFEIGSNDGTLLRCFKEKGMKVLGVDPARKIAESATQAGIPTLPLFFHEGVAKELKAEHGSADVILANNVFAHIDDLASIARGVRHMLSDGGIFVFEVSYLVDVFEKTLFDTIYHEHLDYHSVGPLVSFFEKHGLELINAERVDSHGGSLRATVQKKGGPHQEAAGVQELIQLERKLGLYEQSTYQTFAKNIEAVGEALGRRLRELKSKGKKIAAFGAPAKATTLMHHFKIGPEFVDFIVDDSPLKQGLYSPGYHIPVVSSEAIAREKPDYLVILAWNFADFIVKKHPKFLEEGGHFIVPLPQLKEI
jgi:SAM-dependent methyltransferase